MKLVVTDTNVFIDLMDVGALVPFFALGIEVHTTAFVVNELASRISKHNWFRTSGSGKLKVAQFSGDTLVQLETMRTTASNSRTVRSFISLWS